MAGSVMSSAGALVFPAFVSPPHRQSVSTKSTYSGPPRQPVAGGWSSSSRLVSHISLTSSSRVSSSPLFVSRFFTGGSGLSYREDDVSTSGRTSDISVRIRSKKAASSSSGNDGQSNGRNAGSDVLPGPSPSDTNSAASFTLDQSLEAPSPYVYGDGDGDEKPLLEVTDEKAGAENDNENESSLRTMEERLAAVAQQGKKKIEEVVSGQDPTLPTMQDIVARAAQEGIKLQVRSFGPTFQILVTSLDEDQVFGKADGWIKWWWPKGKILHLESVKLERGLSKQVGNVFGAGFFVGASTLRYGLDHGCQTAELLAVYDDKVTHGKLVKYYSRIGFKTLYEANEEELKYFPDRVVWGGVGTRMDADCEQLLRKWCVVLKPKAKSESRTKGFSSRAQIVQ